MRLFDSIRNSLGGPFGGRVRQAAKELGLDFHTGDADGALLGVGYNGVQYEVFVFRVNPGTVTITVLSSVAFPPNGLPEELFPVLERQNAKMPKCDFTTHHGRRESRFCVRTALKYRDWTSAALMDGLRILIPPAAALDEILAESGYVR